MVKVMEIRVCTDEDLEVLERDLPTGLGRVHQGHLQRARRHKSSYLGAWDGDRVVGTGVIVWTPSPPDMTHGEGRRTTPEIAHLQVHPSFRGRGVGTALIRFGEGLAQAALYPSVIIKVSTDENERAAKLYRRLGYSRPAGSWSATTPGSTLTGSSMRQARPMLSSCATCNQHQHCRLGLLAHAIWARVPGGEVRRAGGTGLRVGAWWRRSES